MPTMLPAHPRPCGGLSLKLCRPRSFKGSLFAPPHFPFKIGGNNKKFREGAMRGVVFHGERELELMQFPDPSPEPHEVVIEMKASGMCGSDLHQYRRPKNQAAQSSGIPMRQGAVIAGHEPCGVVVAVGS